MSKIQSNASGEQSIKVAIRFRPINECDISNKPKQKKGVSFRASKKEEAESTRAWLVLPGSPQAIVQKGTRKAEGKSLFQFDSVFGEETSTREVYDEIGRPIVEGVLNGQHGTIFAYGQTGAGKTHTMQGRANSDGIIHMVAQDLFGAVSAHPERDYSVSVSFVEIYNENLYDLLLSDTNEEARPTSPNSNGSIPGRTPTSPMLTAREDPKRGGVFVNCKEEPVQDASSLIHQLQIGISKRVVAATEMNERASRSHVMFRITVESREKANSTENAYGDKSLLRISTLNLVDLAGSENSINAGNKGLRHREAGKINQSLLALSQVIHSLSLPPEKRPAYINYRDSKLTRILQTSLSGNALMAILCCATASRAFVEETRSTLKFAARAKLIKTDAKINEVVDDGATIRRLEHELAEARSALETLAKREKLAEDTTSASVQELKQIKSMIFGMEEMPDFVSKTARHRTNASTTAPSSGMSTHSVGSARSAPASVVSKSRSVPAVGSPERLALTLRNIDEQASRESYIRSGFSSQASHGDGAFKQTFSGFHSTRHYNGGTIEEHYTNGLGMARTGVLQPPPGEVVVMNGRSHAPEGWGRSSLEYQLQDARQRVLFLESKLEISQDLIESLFKDIEDARSCVHQLVFKNVAFVSKIRRLKEQLHDEEREADELMVQQYNLLKFSMYLGLGLYVFGHHELFLVVIMFIWLCLEAYT